MTVELTHEQATDEIEAVALGITADEVSLGVAAHAARCAECSGELRSFYRVVTALSWLIPERQLNRGHSAGIKSRLIAKTGTGQEAASARRTPRAEPPRAPEPRTPLVRPARVEAEPAREAQDRSSLPMWIAGVATLIALGSIAALWNSRDGGDSLGIDGTTDAQTADSRIPELERLVAEKDATIASLSGRGVRIIGLFNREAREPLGRMFWDRRSDRWTLFVYSLRQPRPGKVFQIWLGTDNGRVQLGTFQPAADGTATFSARHPLASTALNTVSISEEDAGGGARAPTGPVVLAGALR
ncbi:MAG: anti-sigma factor domain-containing protein [Gemmatimonadaceae bacterium]